MYVKHNGWQTPTYRSWMQMKARCYNPNSDQYPRYGARGIRVCKRWKDSFINFRADMGLRPSKSHTLERLDNNRSYTPKNCAWATAAQQAQNRSHTKLTMIKARKIRARYAAGESQYSLASHFGVDQTSISYLVRNRTWKE
jgi:hypothetical protein